MRPTKAPLLSRGYRVISALWGLRPRRSCHNGPRRFSPSSF